MIQDPSQAEIKGVAKLTKKEARSETGLFLLEGPQGLKEALERPKLIEKLFATETFEQKYPELIQRARCQGKCKSGFRRGPQRTL